MKLRLTPLNIVSSLLIVSIAWLIIFPDSPELRGLTSTSLIILLFLCFISDLIFRRLLSDIKRIWLFELLFIIFVAVLMVCIRAFLN